MRISRDLRRAPKTEGRCGGLVRNKKDGSRRKRRARGEATWTYEIAKNVSDSFALRPARFSLSQMPFGNPIEKERSPKSSSFFVLLCSRVRLSSLLLS